MMFRASTPVASSSSPSKYQEQQVSSFIHTISSAVLLSREACQPPMRSEPSGVGWMVKASPH